MHIGALSSFVRAALAFTVPILLVTSCGGSVIVEDPQPECEAGLSPCGGDCVDESSDWQNCGGCGNYCYEGSCVNGVCTGDPGCPPSLIACEGSCVDPASDPYNCGGCFNACPSGICSLGSCVTGECFCGSLCDVVSLGSAVPQSAFSSTNALAEQWVPSCVSGSGPDVVFSFFAPGSGTYSFDTFGSSFGTVVDLVDPGCYSLGCSGGQPGGTSVVMDMFSGQQVLVVVDTQGQSGNIQLNIDFAGNGGCVTCAEFITEGDPGLGFCPGSEELYNVLVECICAEKCVMQCADACSGMADIGGECQECIQDPQFGCGNELNECANDI